MTLIVRFIKDKPISLYVGFGLSLFTALTGRWLFEEEQWTAAWWLPELLISASVAGCLLWSKWESKTLRVADVMVGALAGWCLLVDVFQQSVSLSVLVWWSSLLLLYFLMRCKRCRFTDGRIWIAGLTVLCALHQCGLHSGLFSVPFFRNSSGYAVVLVMGLPFVVYTGWCALKKTGGRMALLWGFGACLTLGALYLTGSRTGWFACLLSGMSVGIYAASRYLSRWVCILGGLGLFAVLCLVLGGLYNMRTSSADGRMLIYRVTTECITDAPWGGHGTMGFWRDYMPRQAEYLVQHPEDEAGKWADNVPYAFNEVLGFILKYGGIGIALFLLALGTLLWQGMASTDRWERMFLLGVVMSLGGMSMFSYPTAYPYVVLLGVATAGCLGNKTPCILKIGFKMQFLIKVLVMGVCLMTTVLSLRRIRAEHHWICGKALIFSGERRAAFRLYHEIVPVLSDCPQFLYNYAAELNYSGDVVQSQQILAHCTRMLNDADTELLAADNNIKLGHYVQAEVHLKRSSEMIPTRFMPLYGLLLLYEVLGEEEKLREVAERISAMAVKVPSVEVEEIKAEARSVLRRLGRC